MENKPTKILFITLSNFGDVILSLPVLDSLRSYFPRNEITVVCGARVKEIFENNPAIRRVIIYDRTAPLREKIGLFFDLKNEGFEVVIDLRNSLYGALLPARYKTSPFLKVPAFIAHMKDRYLFRLRMALGMQSLMIDTVTSKSLYLSAEAKAYINKMLEQSGIKPQEGNIVVVAPAARGGNKGWSRDGFAQVCGDLGRDYKVILVGTEADRELTQYIKVNARGNVIDLAGLTNISQLAHVLGRASLVIVADTGIQHLASYIGAPVLALFGAWNEKKYGPWSDKKNAVVVKEVFCRPCQAPECVFKTVECMKLIKPQTVIARARQMLSGRDFIDPATIPDFKRILIVRTDRIGDVILSTPVIKAFRDYYPNAHIAMMVRPYTADIVDGNPYLDEVIVYDKDGAHKSWQDSMKFAFELRKKNFDLALVLHPTQSAHLITFIAGIDKRVGYNRKWGFLLTDPLPHTKEWGEKHEMEYNLDMVRNLGLEPKDRSLFLPIKDESEKWVDELIGKSGIRQNDKIVAISPGASDPTKEWVMERFAQVADALSVKYSFSVIIVGAPQEAELTNRVRMTMHRFAVDLGGKTSVSQLASVLKRCSLFVGMDSGVMHMACALGLPVVALYGRKQKGLSPVRWGPLSPKSRFLHRDVGCKVCLAHNCTKNFLCFKEITVDDVLGCVDAVLKM
ncbi:MAG: lipopolysaccharide heptosyltransferase II [Candidatus Omnitrophota bacterium]